MTETPTERAARAHYVQEAKRLDHLTSLSLEMWNDPKMAPWRAQKIASMAAALAEYEAAKAEASAAKRERAVEEACVAFGRHVHEHGGMVGDGDELGIQAMGLAITAYERVMAEANAAQPRKEGA